MRALLAAILASALVSRAYHRVPFLIYFWSVRIARTLSRYVQVGRKSVGFWLKQFQGHKNTTVPLEH